MTKDFDLFSNEPIFANVKGELYQIPLGVGIPKIVVIGTMQNYALAKRVAELLNAELMGETISVAEAGK